MSVEYEIVKELLFWFGVVIDGLYFGFWEEGIGFVYMIVVEGYVMVIFLKENCVVVGRIIKV